MKRINNLNGFSLMEMMVVLLIVAIVMAASAPMISRKVIKASENSPWVWLTGGNIGYNLGNKDVTAIIGASTTPSGIKPRFYIKSKDETPQITLDGEGADMPLNISYWLKGKSIGITSTDDIEEGCVAIGYQTIASADSVVIGADATSSNHAADTVIGKYAGNSEQTFDFNDPEKPYSSESGSVVIGHRSNAGEGATAVGPISYAYGDKSVAMGIASATDADADGSIAIGEMARAISKESIAIGKNATAQYGATVVTKNGKSIAIGSGTTVDGNNSIAIGDDATASQDDAIAIGSDAKATGYNSIAIGTNIEASDDNTIVIGNESHQNRVYLGGTLFNSSDRRLKNVGEVFKGGLNELKKLDFFHYTYKKDTNQTPHVGVIAQDLQKVFPDAVVKGKDGFLRIRQEDMFYAAINAIKELDAKITALAKQVKSNLDLITKLQNKVTEQENQITELKKQNQEFEKRLSKLEKHSAK